MPRRLQAVNVVLAVVSLLCVTLIVKQLISARPTVAARARPPAAPAAEPAPAAEARLPAQAYNVVATRNLFSPTRSETVGTGVAGGSAPALIAKPSLHGIVLRDGSPIAYLEDPFTKRIAGYKVGDPIAGGTVQTISADAVVIARPDGTVDVRLRDPSKPRPPAPAVGQPPGPGQPSVGAQPPVPGQVPPPGAIPPRAFTPPAVPGQQPPQAVQPPTPGLPGPLPFGRPSPSVGRRLPPLPTDQGGSPQPSPQQ